MKTATKQKSLQILQIELSKKFSNRDEKLDFLSQFVGYEVVSSRYLSEYRMRQITDYLKRGVIPGAEHWGFFDKENFQHRGVLSRCISFGWNTLKNGQVVADLSRLGAWLQSERSPVNKPLMAMKPAELTKIINALDSMIQKRYR